jgi:hypothetical protein
MLPPALVDLHRRNNQDTAASWERFAGHRAQVTGLTTGAGDGRLAVLGAGNGNDLELVQVTGRYAQVHLVDLDADALNRARLRQPDQVQARLVLHAPVDLSGALAALQRWRDTPPTVPEVAGLARASASQVLSAMNDEYDVVLSACFLSQLMRTCFVALGAEHPYLHAIATALVVGHVRSLVRLTRPGGTALLVTDVVSSETYPLQETFAARDPFELLDELVAADNLFAGTSPAFLERILRKDPDLSPLVARHTRVRPWLWDFSADRVYLVYALVITRAD